MYDTMVTLVGNVATAVEHRETTTGVAVARFRLAVSARRFDRERECWVDGDTSFYTVRAWRALADNVAASVTLGEPLVVHGRLKVKAGEQPAEPGGQRWFSADVEAVAIGHDLARGTSAFRRVVRARTGPVVQPGSAGGGAGADVAPAPAPGPVDAVQGSASVDAAQGPGAAGAVQGPGAAAAVGGGGAAKVSEAPGFMAVAAAPGEPDSAAGAPCSGMGDSPEKVSVP